MRLDYDGIITYASPNAVSAIHRLGWPGEVMGGSMSEIVTSVLRDSSPVDEGLPLVLTGRQPWRTEVGSRAAIVTMRAIPLTEAGQRFGALLLLRDVSELRRREQELLTKDATIREIHHRVKNNLQSVAALLRLQARRTDDEQARAALQEAERRVGTIALVHDTLSRGSTRRSTSTRSPTRGSARSPRWPPTTSGSSASAPATRSAGCAPRTPRRWR